MSISFVFVFFFCTADPTTTPKKTRGPPRVAPVAFLIAGARGGRRRPFAQSSF
jgi:hypothetical protein